jgi:hypothetical protein
VTSRNLLEVVCPFPDGPPCEPFYAPNNYRRWFAWPVLAWCVLLRNPPPPSLDLFSRYVKRMQEAGADEAAEIANQLGLGQELVELITARTIGASSQTNWGQNSAELTEDWSSGASRAQEYWVLQDPWTRQLWPRMLPRWAPLPLEWVQSEFGHFGLRLGGTARPLRISQAAAIAHPPLADRFEAPSPWQLLRAAQKHSGALGRFGSQCVLLSDQPRVGHVLTYLFVDTSTVSGGHATQASSSWQVCDPIKGGINLSFRSYLNEFIRRVALGAAAESEKSPGTVLQALVSNLKDSLGAEASDLILDRESYRRNALAQLSLPASVTEYHPEMAKYLVEWQTRTLMAREETIPEAERMEHVESAVRYLQLAIEAFVCDKVRSNPESAVLANLLLEDSATNAENIRNAASAIGFKTDGAPQTSSATLQATGLPSQETMLKVFSCGRGQAQAVLVSSNNSIQAGLALNLLAAVRDPFHPFRKLADQWPNFMVLLDKLLKLRNDVLHGQASVGDITSLFSQVFGGIQAMFGVSVGADTSTASLDSSTMVAHSRLRQSVTLDIDLKYGDQLPIHAFHLLVSVKRELAMATSAISRESHTSSAVDGRVNIQSAVATTYKLIENLLEPILRPLTFKMRDGPDPDWLQLHPGLAESLDPYWTTSGPHVGFPSPTRQRLAELLIDAVRRAGFTPPEYHRAAFWDSVLRVRPDRLVHALQGGRAPMSARIAALSLLVPLSDCLQGLAKASPGFIADSALLCHWRGHGDCRYAPENPAEVDAIVDGLVGCLLALQPID